MIDNNRQSFILYYAFWNMLKKLSDEQLGKLFRAIYIRQIDGIEPDFGDDLTLDMAYGFVYNQISIDAKKWLDIKMSRSEAGKKSGESRRAKKQEDKPFNAIEQNEQMFDLLNKNEHNGNDNAEKKMNAKGIDDGDDVVVNVKNASTIISNINVPADLFWSIYPIIYFNNYPNPVFETKRFIAYYEANDWTLEGGKKLISLKDKVLRARKWKPETASEKHPRVDEDFIGIWYLIFKYMLKKQVPSNIVRYALDERITITIKEPNLYLSIPPELVEYVENNSYCQAKMIELVREKRLEKSIINILNAKNINTYSL